MQPAYDLYITMKGIALKLLQSRGAAECCN